MKKFYNIEDFLDSAILFNLQHENVTTVLDVELAEEFLSRLDDEYVSANIEFCDEFEDGCVFAIDKIEDKEHEVFIYIYDIYNRETGTAVDLENDYIFLQKDVLEELEVDNIYFNEELLIGDLTDCEEYDFTEYDDSFDNENEDLEETCDCGNCQCRVVKDECFEDLIERFIGEILSSKGCPCCIEETLYSFAEAIREFDDNELDEEDMEEVDLSEVINGVRNLELVKALVRKITDRNEF